MSELQIGLLIAGAVVVVLVVVWNRVAEARARRSAENVFRAPERDALVDGAEARREPTLAGQGDEAAASAVSVAPDQPRDDAPKAVLSPVVDTVALVVAEASVDRQALAGLERSLAPVGKPFHVEGLEGDRWVPVAASARDGWRELRVGLQLAARDGPASEEAVSAFNEAVAAFANAMGAVSQRESPVEAASRARDLDALCAETDVELVLNLRGRAGMTFAVQRVRELAAEQGLAPAGPGGFALPGGDGVPLLTLRFADNPPPREGGYATGLTFAFDVPHAADPHASLDALASAAQRFAQALAADVVDDGGRPLTPAGLASIRRSLEPVVTKLAESGIPAGSALARRLFS